MAYKDFADDEILYAADVDNFLMRQTVMVFTNEAARTAALGTVVTEGMFTFLTATDSFQYYTGSAWENVVATSGDITSITAGTALTGGGTAGDVTLNVNMNALTINATQVVNTQVDSSATSYTFNNSDQGKTVRFTASSTVTATIGTATALTAGQRIDVLREGTGQVNISAGAGVSIAGAGTAASAFSIGRYEAASIYCVAANTYRIIGNVAAV